MNETKKELNKIKDSTSKVNTTKRSTDQAMFPASNLSVTRDYYMGDSSAIGSWSSSLLTHTSTSLPPDVNIPRTVGGTAATAQVGSANRAHLKITPPKNSIATGRRVIQSNADLRSDTDGKRNEQLSVTAFGSGLRNRSNSE